jgi:serine/threonine-protein kinase
MDSGGEQFRPGDVLSERYELLQQVGSGASAITWRARDRRLDRDVAIKILRRSYAMDPTFAQRFDREARTAASVSHGNVVDIYDVGHDGDTLYLVMQYIQGEDLKHLIQRSGAIDPDRARDLTLQVLAGLQAIHTSGIIHRDIKPQNVLIGRDGVAQVTDFGVAQVSIDVGLTTVGTTVGTAAYMAPEQARAETLSEATDLYAVGVMLYEMLTGKLPFNGPTHMAIMLAHIQQDAPVPSDTPGTSPMFDGVIRQAMAKEPRDRFRSAQAMARALTNVSTNQAQGTRTVQTPVVAPSQRTQTSNARSARSGAWPTPSPATSADLDWAKRSAGSKQGSNSGNGGGVRAALWGFLFLIVLMLGAIGVYAYNEFVADNDSNDPPETPPVLATRTPVDETAEPTDTDEEVPTIGPEDTEEPEPTDEPTEEPDPTHEPTEEPTATDEPTATEEEIIEPEATSGIIEPSDPRETPAG